MTLGAGFIYSRKIFSEKAYFCLRALNDTSFF